MYLTYPGYVGLPSLYADNHKVDERMQREEKDDRSPQAQPRRECCLLGMRLFVQAERYG